MNPPAEGHFPATQWSLIARIKSLDAAVAAKALDELCAQYHYPLYCYLRRRGCAHHDAEDVLHDFLAGILRQHALERVELERGRLRGYLSISIARHLQHWREREARREQPASAFESGLDFESIGNRYAHEQFNEADTPDRVFERQWVMELLRQVLEALAVRYAEKGRTALFDGLRPALERGGSLRGGDAPALAARLGITEEALRVALGRLLREFRKEMEAAVRLTVEDAAEVPAELAYLLGLFQG